MRPPTETSPLTMEDDLRVFRHQGEEGDRWTDEDLNAALDAVHDKTGKWVIDLRSNRLTQFQFLLSFEDVIWLDLNGNELESFPLEILSLSNLSLLSMSNQKIGPTLPRQIGNLIHLEYLAFYDNNITRLPQSLGNCKKLEKVWFNSNPISPKRFAKSLSSICSTQNLLEEISEFYSFFELKFSRILCWLWIGRLPPQNRPEYLRAAALKDIFPLIAKLGFEMLLEEEAARHNDSPEESDSKSDSDIRQESDEIDSFGEINL